MAESDKFSPATEQALSATLDVSRHAIAEARSNMRILTATRDAAEKRIEELEKELEQAQQRIKESLVLEQQALDVYKAGAEDLRMQGAAAADTVHALEKQLSDSGEQRRAIEEQLGKASEEQRTLEDELSKALSSMSGLTQETERLERALAEARAELADRDAQQANDEQLGNALQMDLGALRRSMEQLDERLHGQAANPVLMSPHKDKRVIWIGSGECFRRDLCVGHRMEVLAVSDPKQALEILSGQGADGLVTDIAVTGIDWLSDVRKRWPGLIIIVTTGHADVHLAVSSSLDSIAAEVIAQPYEPEDVAVAVRCAFLRKALSSNVETLDMECTPARPRLLLAEDDEPTRRLLSMYLDGLGYDTRCVEDGAAALEAIEANEFDVLLASIQMPRMDGIELTARAKKLKPKLPIIILSATGGLDTSLKTLRAGAYGYVRKPADTEELSLFIERAMLGSRVQAELREQNTLLDKRNQELDEALRELQETANLVASNRRPRAEQAVAKDRHAAGR